METKTTASRFGTRKTDSLSGGGDDVMSLLRDLTRDVHLGDGAHQIIIACLVHGGAEGMATT